VNGRPAPDSSEEQTDDSRPRRRQALIRARTPLWTLPAQPSPLIGRAGALAVARALLLRDDVRFVTLNGPPGVGKTRLAVALAERVRSRFPDGVAFVDLAPIRDPRLVVPTIARGLCSGPPAGRTAIQALQDFLADRRALLVLDNFEHVLGAAPRLAEILTACPFVTFVVTSRAVLHLRWEHMLEVPPLALPDPRQISSRAALARTPAVTLFVDRARAVDPAFALTAENGPTVAELCVRLDGLPLAIELAARQVRTYPPAVILQRLTRALGSPTAHPARTTSSDDALGRGPRDLPARQQTLDSAIARSYELLTADEQAVFRRLAVFESSFTPDAAEDVCNGVARAVSMNRPQCRVDEGRDQSPVSHPASLAPRPSPLDLLARLVDSSLLVRHISPDQDQPRYRMLETIRQFAANRLAVAGETAAARPSHRDWYLQLVETADREVRRGGAPAWPSRLDAEYENIRAALAWSEERGEHRPYARLVAALWWYWQRRGLTGETHHELTRALAVETDRLAIRAKILNGGRVRLRPGRV